MTRKDEIYSTVLNSALQLDFRKGHKRWSLTDLSRSTGITRSLIYYYFGNSKDQILVEAVKLLGAELFGLVPERLALWNQKAIQESVYRTRLSLEKNPHLIAFYFVHRNEQSAIGEAIRELEAGHKKKLRSYISKASENRLEALWGFLLGLVIAPKISRPAIEKSVQIALGLAGNPD